MSEWPAAQSHFTGEAGTILESPLSLCHTLKNPSSRSTDSIRLGLYYVQREDSRRVGGEAREQPGREWGAARGAQRCSGLWGAPGGVADAPA